MPTLQDLPLELFLSNIFPILPIPDLLSLSSTNRDFRKLCSDETFWKQRTKADYNFDGSEIARITAWKSLYKRLSNPKVYVWGQDANGRLGSTVPRTRVGGIPYPLQLRIPGARIASLAAGGMSFHALDARGSLYVWGTLDGSHWASPYEGFCKAGTEAPRPMRLDIPATIFRSITCGRLHAAALDSNSVIWNFESWGRPFRLASPLVDRSIPETTPVQVECGWSFTAILTLSSDVLVYWPKGGRMKKVIVERNKQFDRQGSSTMAIVDDDPTKIVPNIPCYLRSLEGVDPVRLPPIPSHLPALANANLPKEVATKETKLIKIAAMENMVIGLTNKGHVLMYGSLSGENVYEQGGWEYLPYFSELAKIKENDIFAEGKHSRLDPPRAMRITHISAQFKTFAAYSTTPESIVLVGHSPQPEIFDPQNQDDQPSLRSLRTSSFRPSILWKLQYQSVISVVLGDYHFGALTSTGRLLTWGSFSSGALGLGMGRGGYMKAVGEPSEVLFDEEEGRQGTQRNWYVFGATAAGWHTGALVVDLDVAICALLFSLAFMTSSWGYEQVDVNNEET